MTATNEAWISDSLARLEQLESQRDQLARAGRADALAELDEEIKSLYEVLESAAQNEGSEADEAANNSPVVPHPAFGPTPYPMVSQMTAPSQFAAAAPEMSPSFSTPMDQPAFHQQPMMAQPAFDQQPMMAQPAFAQQQPDFSGGDDEPSSGKGAIIGIAVVVLLAAGGGGWWFMNRTPEAPTVQAPSGPAKVFQAGAISDDTQEPDVAKGGDATRTPLVEIKERAVAEPDRRPSGPRPSGNPPATRPTNPDKAGRTDGINVDKSNDPLAGVR